jgi:uncharacterized membrane protein
MMLPTMMLGSRRRAVGELGLISIVVALWAIVLSGHCAACAGTAPAVVDITALELGCVAVAATKQASEDCRNAVRAAWAKANGVEAGPLAPAAGSVEGGGQ